MNTRMTKQRRMMLEKLCSMKTHPTAEEFYLASKGKSERLSFASVYRNLEYLSSKGMITKLEYPGRQNRFDADMSEHCHMRCTKCGAVSDISIEGIGSLNRSLESLIKDHLDIEGYILEFKGICNNCKPKGK